MKKKKSKVTLWAGVVLVVLALAMLLQVLPLGIQSEFFEAHTITTVGYTVTGASFEWGRETRAIPGANGITSLPMSSFTSSTMPMIDNIGWGYKDSPMLLDWWGSSRVNRDDYRYSTRTRIEINDDLNQPNKVFTLSMNYEGGSNPLWCISGMTSELEQLPFCINAQQAAFRQKDGDYVLIADYKPFSQTRYTVVFSESFASQPRCGNDICEAGEYVSQCFDDCALSVIMNETCYFEIGEFLVFDRFGTNYTINEDTVTYKPLRYCLPLQPVVLNDLTREISLRPDIVVTLQAGESYVVPEHEVVGVYYIAAMPPTLEKACKQGESYVVKEGVCATSGIATPCVDGILQEDGTCLVQPELEYECEGQLRILSDGSRVCTLSVPIREEYICYREDGSTEVVDNPALCASNLTNQYYCDGIPIDNPTQCESHLQLTEQLYCDGVLVDDLDDCISQLSRRYYCEGVEISDPTLCKTTVLPKYYCNNVEVDSPEDCSESLETSYTCAGIPVNSSSDCRSSLQMSYLCFDQDGNFVKEVANPNECAFNETIQRKFLCDDGSGATVPVDDESECVANLQMKWKCTKGNESWLVDKPEDCTDEIEPALLCGGKVVTSIDECKKEVEPEIVIKCIEGEYDVVSGYCVKTPPLLPGYAYAGIGVLSVLGIVVYIIKFKK